MRIIDKIRKSQRKEDINYPVKKKKENNIDWQATTNDSSLQINNFSGLLDESFNN
jgi:hypothetical protein